MKPLIDIKPYIDKLELLNKYMTQRISRRKEIWMDLKVCPDEWYIKSGRKIPIPYKETFYFIEDFNTFYNNNQQT